MEESNLKSQVDLPLFGTGTFSLSIYFLYVLRYWVLVLLSCGFIFRKFCIKVFVEART